MSSLVCVKIKKGFYKPLYLHRQQQKADDAQPDADNHAAGDFFVQHDMAQQDDQRQNAAVLDGEQNGRVHAAEQQHQHIDGQRGGYAADHSENQRLFAHAEGLKRGFFLRAEQINEGDDSRTQESDDDHLVALRLLHELLLRIKENAVSAVGEEQQADPQVVALFVNDEGGILQVDQREGQDHHAHAEQLIYAYLFTPVQRGKGQRHQHGAGIGHQILQRIRAGARGIDKAEVIDEKHKGVDQPHRPCDGGSAELEPGCKQKRGQADDQPVNCGKNRRGSQLVAGVADGI